RPRRPATREPLVRPPAEQERIGAHGVLERELEEVRPVLDRPDPPAALEAFVARRILEDPVDRDVVADDDPAHWRRLRFLLLCPLSNTVSGNDEKVNRQHGAGCSKPNVP